MKIICATFFFAALVIPTLSLCQNSGFLDQRDDESVSGEDQPRAAAPATCADQSFSQIKDPRIEITSTSGSPKSQRSLRLQGYVEGVCLSEAGLFQNGQEQESISVSTLPKFKRFEFDLTVSGGKKREIRVYNTRGGRARSVLPDSDAAGDPLGIGVDQLEDNGEIEEEATE